MNIEPVTKCGFMFPFCTGQDNQDERKCLWLLSENKLLSQTCVNFQRISVYLITFTIAFLKATNNNYMGNYPLIQPN